MRFDQNLLSYLLFFSLCQSNLSFDDSSLELTWLVHPDFVAQQIQLRLDACTFQQLTLLLLFKQFKSLSLFCLLSFLLSYGFLRVLFGFEPLLLCVSSKFVSLSLLGCLDLPPSFCLEPLLPGPLLGVQLLLLDSAFFGQPFLSLLPLSVSRLFPVLLLLKKLALFLLSGPLKLPLLLLPGLGLLLLFPLLFDALLLSFALKLLPLLLLLIIKPLLAVGGGLLLGQSSLPLLLELLTSFVDHWLALWAVPVRILIIRGLLQGKTVLFAVSLQAFLNVEGSGAVVAANQLAAIFANVAVIAVLDLASWLVGVASYLACKQRAFVRAACGLSFWLRGAGCRTTTSWTHLSLLRFWLILQFH